MKFVQAKRLHNGDYVLSKRTGENIRVLTIETRNEHDGGRKNLCPPPCVRIEGVGEQSGYAWWSHDEVR